jgi:hypothetical protein
LINICEFQGFVSVKRLFVYLTMFTLSSYCFGQGTNGTSVAISFADSVRIVLENTRNVDATVIGSGFTSAWTALGLDQQQTIQKQVYLMRKKGYQIKPHFINYFGALVNAVNVEHADGSKITSYLTVTGQVLENQPVVKANAFLATARSFFENHAIHYEKSFRLYARDDSYSFDYIAPPPQASLSWDDTTATESQSEITETVTETESTEVVSLDDQPLVSDTEEVMPAWMTPPPPPYIEGPVIKFDKVSLNFVTRYDSVFLKNSSGTFSLTENIFVGEGGSFDWTAAGLPADSVYCEFTTYNFKTTKSTFKADLVKLNYTGKTPGLIPGTFEFASEARKDSALSHYPKFVSYQSDLKITGLADENVTYTGGFSLLGDKITSGSVSGEDASIEIYHEGSKRIMARSNSFIFGDSTITTDRAHVKILDGNDSLVHRAIQMRYYFGADSTQRLMLRKQKGEMKNAPYASSFYNIDFAADVIRWDLYSDSLNILTDGGRNTVPVVVESVDYYDEEDYRLLKGVGFDFHPLALVANYCLKKRVREFYSGDLAQFSKKDPQHIKQAMQFLAQKGMIVYNNRTDLVQVKKKAVDLYKAYKGELDYDNVKIHSIIDSLPNATINFKEKYMTVRGVEEFNVSDSLNVRIKPDSAIITLLQNRDMKFDGTITAGNFEISGKGFTLKYDSFFIDLKRIDSINFYVTEKNAKGQEIRRKINNSMVGADSAAAATGGLVDASKTSGTLFISKANNKSGKKKIPNYPRLDASAGGVIYFDREEVLGGVYDRSMFFVVPPFKLDSLNDADPASINFQGTFASSGMFPNFKEKLHTQPDKSLGFDHAIPKGGYQLYKGDGKMNGVLTMDNRGLRGVGHINYLAATIHSPDFVFYPDSVIARGNSAKIEEKQFGNILFPQASLSDFDMKWYPKEDKMKLKNLKYPFNFYDSTAQMQGTITISKSGVSGAGKLETRGTELISRDMNFTGQDFSARHARFKVNTTDPQKPLFSGNDIRLKFNLKENYADISPEIEGVAAINFPFAQFKTSIPKARWDLDEQKITMSKDANVPIENSYFYTTRKDLDSLSFNAERAEYDLKKQELKVSGIPYIIVADAKITPENNEVLILENAKIGTLKNTTIVLDTLDGFHRLTEGVVDIVSRKEFSGYATYQYVNLLNDTFAIKMTDFHLEPIETQEKERRRSQRNESIATMQTVATGAVSDHDSLVLGAGLYYKGDMIMYATRPALQLAGYVRLDVRNLGNTASWLKYSQSGEETDVYLDFDNAVTEEGKKPSAGLHFTSNTNELYATFVSDKKSEEDDDFFRPSGTLFYDKEVNEYRIEDREKAAGNKLSGKVFTYNDEKRSIKFEGPVKFFTGNKSFSVTATALGTGLIQTNEYRMNTFVMIDSDIPPDAFAIMAKNLQDVIKNEGAAEGLGDQTELLYKIADIVGERTVKDFEQRSQQGYVSLSTLPPLIKPLVFADVNMKWHPKQKAFFSEGNLGLSHILKMDVNGGFEGFMESKRNEDGLPVFHVFIKASPESWYYFGFEDNRLLVHSSNDEFNNIIGKKTNAGKAKVGEVAFLPATEEETLAFINRFRKEYYGIDVPYSLSEGTSAVEKKKEEKKKEDEDDGF